jgi:catechol 2,3-dioxygenase-like lactoylglutathione lyase family enzyme
MSAADEIISLDHIIIAVADLKAAEADYSRIFGRSPSWRGVHAGRGTGNVLYRLRNTYVELYAPIAEGPGADALKAKLDAEGEGLFGLAFRVRDAQAANIALRNRGLEVSDPVSGLGQDSSTGAIRAWSTFGIFPARLPHVTLLAIEHKSSADLLPPAKCGAGIEELSAIDAADHVVFVTRDAEACKNLFAGQMQLRLALDQTKPEWGARQLFFRLGGVTIEVVEPLDAAKKPDHDQLAGLAWHAPDIAALHRRVSESGGEISEIRKGRKEGTSVATLKSFTHGVSTLLIA